MTPNAYREAISRLGLSQIEAARFLGVGDRAARRFATDGAPRSVELTLVLAIMLVEEFGVSLGDIRAL